jgi:hypothetical protein
MLKKINALLGAQDMTVGKPMSALLRFSIPLLIGNFAQNCELDDSACGTQA